MLLAGGLLVLNMITFPTAPAEAGLMDLGPFVGLWMLVLFIWFAVALFRNPDTTIQNEIGLNE